MLRDRQHRILGKKAVAFYVLLAVIVGLAVLGIVFKTAIESVIEKITQLGMTYLFGQSTVDTVYHLRQTPSNESAGTKIHE